MARRVVAVELFGWSDETGHPANRFRILVASRWGASLRLGSSLTAGRQRIKTHVKALDRFVALFLSRRAR